VDNLQLLDVLSNKGMEQRKEKSALILIETQNERMRTAGKLYKALVSSS